VTSEETYQHKLAHLLACKVPTLEAEVVAKGPDETASTRAVREWVRSGKTFCLLVGSAGCGKTIAAAEALLNAKAAWDEGRAWCYCPSEARFILSTELARLSYFDVSALNKLGRIERVPWLVLDDLGGELLTDTWKSNLTELILERNSARRRTVITTNLGAEAFKARYDERIVSRIRGNGTVVVSGSEDMRREQPFRRVVMGDD
jgi:DNA replication protein DnaC